MDAVVALRAWDGEVSIAVCAGRRSFSEEPYGRKVGDNLIYLATLHFGPFSTRHIHKRPLGFFPLLLMIGPLHIFSIEFMCVFLLILPISITKVAYLVLNFA